MRQILDLRPCEPSLGLALEEVLLDSARQDNVETVRLWVNQPAVILGRSQSRDAEVDVAKATAFGIPTLRRLSGGGTVYHYPGNLNISVAMQKRTGLADVSAVFAFFGRVIAAALGRLGIEVHCEDNGLFIGDLKIGGAAQAHRGTAVLYHTTLLVKRSSISMNELLLAMQHAYSPSGVASRPRRTASLERILQAPLEMASVAGEIATALASCLDVPMEQGVLSDAEKDQATQLRDTKYGSQEWNERL